MTETMRIPKLPVLNRLMTGSEALQLMAEYRVSIGYFGESEGDMVSFVRAAKLSNAKYYNGIFVDVVEKVRWKEMFSTLIDGNYCSCERGHVFECVTGIEGSRCRKEGPLGERCKGTYTC